MITPEQIRREMRDTVERSGLLHDERDEWIRDQAIARAEREVEQARREREAA